MKTATLRYIFFLTFCIRLHMFLLRRRRLYFPSFSASMKSFLAHFYLSVARWTTMSTCCTLNKDFQCIIQCSRTNLQVNWFGYSCFKTLLKVSFAMSLHQNHIKWDTYISKYSSSKVTSNTKKYLFY